MKEENKDFQKRILETLGEHQKKINNLRREVDVLKEYAEFLQKHRDLPMARTTVDKNGRKELM